MTRVVLTLALVAGAICGLWALGVAPGAYVELQPSQILGFTPVDLQTELGRAQLSRIRYSLDVYRAETGSYPDNLNQLVQGGLLKARDLRYPWQQSYYYQRRDAAYELLRPLY